MQDGIHHDHIVGTHQGVGYADSPNFADVTVDAGGKVGLDGTGGNDYVSYVDSGIEIVFGGVTLLRIE